MRRPAQKSAPRLLLGQTSFDFSLNIHAHLAHERVTLSYKLKMARATLVHAANSASCKSFGGSEKPTLINSWAAFVSFSNSARCFSTSAEIALNSSAVGWRQSAWR